MAPRAPAPSPALLPRSRILAAFAAGTARQVATPHRLSYHQARTQPNRHRFGPKTPARSRSEGYVTEDRHIRYDAA